MKFEDAVARIDPLLRLVPGSDLAHLRRLLTAPEAHDAFMALDNELFVHNRDAGTELMVASATRGEGRTTFALLLAVLTCAADADRRVLLVDGDFDNGCLGRVFGIEDGAPGLADYFDGKAQADQAVHATALPNLLLAPVSLGSRTPVRFAPRRFRCFMEDIRGRYDLVVVDTPAGGPNKAVISMASVVKRVLLVVKYGGPTREQVIQLMDNLARSGGEVMGAVLNLREYVVPRMMYGQR